MTDLENLQSFTKLVLAVGKLRSTRPLEVGWDVNAVLDEALVAECDQPDAPAKRSIYGMVLDQLAEYFAGTSDWDTPEAARAKLVDYARVGRFFTSSRYKKIYGQPKFSQLRACLVKSSVWFEYPEDEIMQRVSWAEDNGWPATSRIREHFAPHDDEELSEDDERWDAFDKARKIVYDRAIAYLDATATLYGPTINERRKEAQKIVDAFGEFPSGDDVKGR